MKNVINLFIYKTYDYNNKISLTYEKVYYIINIKEREKYVNKRVWKYDKTTHTHTHTHNCYKQVAVDFYAIFVRNVNKKYIENLVKESEFL